MQELNDRTKIKSTNLTGLFYKSEVHLNGSKIAETDIKLSCGSTHFITVIQCNTEPTQLNYTLPTVKTHLP